MFYPQFFAYNANSVIPPKDVYLWVLCFENLPQTDNGKEIQDERHVSGGSRISDSCIEALVFIAILRTKSAPLNVTFTYTGTMERSSMGRPPPHLPPTSTPVSRRVPLFVILASRYLPIPFSGFFVVVAMGWRRVEKAGREIQQYAETAEASSDIAPAIQWASSCGVSVASVLRVLGSCRAPVFPIHV